MADYIDGWEVMWRDRIAEAYHSRRRDPRHPALVEEAALRGYRPATLGEILSSSAGDNSDTYGWCGEVWMKLEAPPVLSGQLCLTAPTLC